MDLNGAELIAHHLETEGVTHVVGPLPPAAGNTLLPLYRTLADTRIVHVPAQHEQGAGFIAHGIARIGGRAGVCLSASANGVTGLLGAIADAQADAVPLVAICGRASSRSAPGALRTGHLVDSVTKTHFEIREVADLVDALPEAFRVAESGRPGPVVIEVPKDVQTARIRLATLPAPTPRDRETSAAPASAASALVETAEAAGADDRAATLIRSIAAALGPDACIVTDTGQPQRWAARHYPRAATPRWLTSSVLGSTGFALPAAIGAALAMPEGRVAAFCSHAGLLANTQELATLADLQLDVKLIVIDDDASDAPQLHAYLPRRRFVGPARGRTPALCTIAEAFGIAATDLALAPRPLARLRETLSQPGPALIRAPLRVAVAARPMTTFNTAAVAALR